VYSPVSISTLISYIAAGAFLNILRHIFKIFLLHVRSNVLHDVYAIIHVMKVPGTCSPR